MALINTKQQIIVSHLALSARQTLRIIGFGLESRAQFASVMIATNLAIKGASLVKFVYWDAVLKHNYGYTAFSSMNKIK